jgi:hypothetical protein
VAIHSQSNHSPITLSGIVQQGGASVTTELTVGFQFHMPYLTREGTATTLSIVTGPDATIDTILDLLFIQQTKMIIGASDQVPDLCALNAPPFDMTFGTPCVLSQQMRAGQTSPTLWHNMPT